MKNVVSGIRQSCRSNTVEDEIVWVVTVQTSKGTHKQPVVKIFGLENEEKFEVPQYGENVR